MQFPRIVPELLSNISSAACQIPGCRALKGLQLFRVLFLLLPGFDGYCLMRVSFALSDWKEDHCQRTELGHNNMIYWKSRKEWSEELPFYRRATFLHRRPPISMYGFLKLQRVDASQHRGGGYCVAFRMWAACKSENILPLAMLTKTANQRYGPFTSPSCQRLILR